MADFLILDDDKKVDSVNDVIEESINKSSEASLMDKLNAFLFSVQRIKTKDKVIFYRLLSTMINAGVSLLKAVSILEKQERNPILKKVLTEFTRELKEGKNLSECMEKFPKNFDQAEIGIVKSGEKIGLLNKSLTDLADQIEKVQGISGKIRSAMMYPAFVILVVIVVIFIMMIKVVPNLLEIFESKETLPASTQVLIAMSNFFVGYWWLMALFIFLAVSGFIFWKGTEDGRYIFDNFKMKIPIFGEIIQKTVLSKFSRIFSGLIGSGVSIVESLKITAEAVGNEAYKQRILLLSQDVAGGIKIWESIDGDKLFPDMMVQMIQVGEQTAKLDQTIAKVADFYDEQVNNIIGALNKLLEPFILVTLAVVVGFVALAIMQPIMNLADTVSNM